MGGGGGEKMLENLNQKSETDWETHQLLIAKSGRSHG